MSSPGYHRNAVTDMINSSVGTLPLAIMAAIGKEGQAELASLWVAEPPLGGDEGPGSKAGSNGPGVLLLRLGYPPSHQVPLLMDSLTPPQ